MISWRTSLDMEIDFILQSDVNKPKPKQHKLQLNAGTQIGCSHKNSFLLRIEIPGSDPILVDPEYMMDVCKKAMLIRKL